MKNIDLMKIYSDTDFPEVYSKTINGCGYKYVPYIISEDNGNYQYKYLLIKASDYTYEGLVNVIIGLKFYLSETLAILYNYLSNPKYAKYKAEFDELQIVRTEAKDYAKKHFNR